MQNCRHCVYDSLHKRYLKETPSPKYLDRALIKRIILDLVDRIKHNLKPFDEAGFLARKTGALRSRYLKAYREIEARGFDINNHSDISAFVKLERYYEEGKAPRMIMGRNPKFNWLYATIIEPIEQAFFSLDQVANACDNFACGAKFSKLVGEWFMENDMSKFEASQRRLVLNMEFEVYSRIFPEQQELINVLFAAKTHKKGTTGDGVSFEFEYCRGSGDMDTSLGNGILNYIATQYFLVKNFCDGCELSKCPKPGCRSMKFVVKGDDSYMTVPRYCSPHNYYEHFGFDAKLILRKAPHEVEFCSGHFVEYQPNKYVYVQKLAKLLQSLTTCINDDAIRNGWVAHYYKSLGMMYNKLYAGIPVYEEIGKFLLTSNVDSGLNLNLIGSYNLLMMFKNIQPCDRVVDYPLAYTSVMLVNNLDVAQMEAVKIYLRTSKLEFPSNMTKICRIRTPKIIDQEYNIQWQTLRDQVCRDRINTEIVWLHYRRYKSLANTFTNC
jgi:hypothetical protein